MKRLKKVKKEFLVTMSCVLLVGVFLAMFLAVGCAPKGEEGAPTPTEKPTYHWQVSTMDPEGGPAAEMIHRFAEQVLEDSDGRIVIDAKPGGVLGDWLSLQEEIMRGTTEMQLACCTGKWDIRLDATLMPYLVTNYDEAYAAWGTDGKLLRYFNEEVCPETDLYYLTAWSADFNGFSYAERLPANYGDPDSDKGMKARIAPVKMRETLAKRFGYQPVSMPGSDVYHALSTGMVDCNIGFTPTLTWDMHRDVIKYWLQMNEVFQVFFLETNRTLFYSLSEEDQQIITNAAKAQAEVDWEKAAETQQYYLDKMADYGIEVVYLTDEELAAYSKATKEDIWPVLEEDYGTEFMDDVAAIVASL